MGFGTSVMRGRERLVRDLVEQEFDARARYAGVVWARVLPMLAALLAIHCGGEDQQETDPTGSGGGVVTTGCEPGDTPLDDGSCRPPGVPPDGCAAGFSANDHGCDPILPASPCPEGQMAVPGETECHEVAPCGTAPWGDIPIDASTVYVDASYTGGMSDGSAADPYTAIQQAIDAAAADSIIAIAAGVYAEDVVIGSKPVKLWGRCPALVEITSSGGLYPALIFSFASGTAEVHNVSVRDAGIEVSASNGPLIERVWVHDTSDRGISALADLAPTAFTLRHSLVERATEIGVYLQGAVGTIESSAVRDTLPNSGQEFGRGISVRDQPTTRVRGGATIRSSVIERNHYSGVHVAGSDVTIDASVIRDQLPQPLDDDGGRGINVQVDIANGLPSTLQLTGSVVQGNRGAALYACGSITVERSVLRDTLPNLSPFPPKDGRGISIQGDLDTGARGALTMRDSLVAGNEAVGVFVAASDATIEGTLVRDTRPRQSDGTGGRGLDVQDATNLQRGNALIRYSAFENSREVGIFVAGSQIELEGVAIRDTTPNDGDDFGTSMVLIASEFDQARSGGIVRRSAFERGFMGGIYMWQSDTSIEQSRIQGVSAIPSSDLFGDGLLVDFGSVVSVDASRIESTARAGIANFGSEVSLTNSVLECNPIPLNGEQMSVFRDLGGNTCGCAGQNTPCKVQSTMLAAPEPPPVNDPL